jgi:hypothetical protein
MTTHPFEVHITVRNPDLEFFKAVCAANGLKPIILDLQNHTGTTVLQDVMTSSRLDTTPQEAYRFCERMVKRLELAGLEVVRRKIETVPWYPQAPSQADEDMLDGQYFEAHIAVSITRDQEEALRQAGAALRAHVSRNIFKQNGDTLTIMLTVRDYTHLGRFTENVNSVITGLCARGFHIKRIEREFCLWDSNTLHDKAWLNS